MLPPASDYRQSLIMPHLTRRFTLLRAPDGSLVSPEAMRAHLRAQRARARAANLALGSGTAHQFDFLTEDEENEIIEQLKAQALAEGHDFDRERSMNVTTADSWHNGYAAGTDGFGSWGSVPTNNPDKLSSLTDSLGDLSSSNLNHPSTSTGASSSAWSPTRNPGGSSFTGRSTERDNACFRTVKRERKISRPDESLPSPLNSALEPSQNTTLTSASTKSEQRSPDAARSQPEKAHDNSMPGAFATSQDGHTTRHSSPTKHSNESSDPKPFLDVSVTSKDSNLLTTLSPEAFKRVSTALNEVFGLIASERGPSPSVRVGSADGSGARRHRSSGDSDANSFASAVSNVRALDAEQEQQSQDDGDGTADRTITGTQPSLDAVHIEQGRLAVPSPLPGPIPGSLPPSLAEFAPEMTESQTLRQIPSLTTSESAQTLTDAETATDDLMLAPNAASAQHLSVSRHSVTDSTLTYPSERSSTATARDPQVGPSRTISTASTVDALQTASHELPITEVRTASARPAELPSANQGPSDNAMHQANVVATGNRGPLATRPDRTPEMDSSATLASPARSTLSRGDSLVSSSSIRSSLTAPSASYQGTHSRKSSADKLALARAMAPHPHLREQPSLSSIRRNFQKHNRSATGSSEGSLLGTHASRRSSGAISPSPVLSRSARSPNYFPPPPSSASMYDYASGFKPPSAVSPAAAAALQSMTNQASQVSPPVQGFAAEASSAFGSAQNMRSSASTGQSVPSPYVSSLAAFPSGSDRAAATSSPETGATSISLHRRNVSLTSTKQPAKTQSARISVADDGLSPFMYAPRPAPLPAMCSLSPSATPSQSNTDGNGLMPQHPSDPEHSDKWRTVYGYKTADAASLHDSAENASVNANEEEDLWAKMALASEVKKAERPISNFPPNMAEERLASTGITLDQIAQFQDRLVQTASGREELPPVPRISTGNRARSEHKQQRFAVAKSLGLASPNLVSDAGADWSKSAESPRTVDNRAFAGSNAVAVDTGHHAPIHRSLSSSLAQEPPVSPRAVMYDVTTSHRPTSPPLHSRNASLNGLPNLLELNGAIGRRNRESISLSQAVDQASRLPRHPAFDAAQISEDPESSIDQDSQYATAINPVQDHPFNAGYTSPSLGSGSLRSGNTFTFPRKSSAAGVGDSPRHHAQPFPPEQIWDRYGPQQEEVTSGLSNTGLAAIDGYQGSDPTRLLDDIAAQTSAATRALKGTADGSVATPPFRTKSISRKKSFKKFSKQISSPQLISTTQKLDHATQLRPSLEMPNTQTWGSRWPNRSPGWGSIGPSGGEGTRRHAKASQSVPSQMSSFGKSSLYFHRRRSSSFGHEASPDESFGTPEGEISDTLVSAEQTGSDQAAHVHPNHPYMNGGANGGSLSRLLSKIKSRKNEHGFGGATIEPFPPELSTAARAPEFSSQPQPQPLQHQQRPTTPELSSLVAVESRTLPRMPPSPSSTDQGSNLRSPTSPRHPLIDSTSLPRSRTKKRTPIVLKRESEVILPGDKGYVPNAMIGGSSEQRATPLAEQQTEGSASPKAHTAAKTNAVAIEESDRENTTDTTLEKFTERTSYSQNGNLITLAPPTGSSKDNDEAATPRAASPKPAGDAGLTAGAAAIDKQPEDAEDADETITKFTSSSQPQTIEEDMPEGTEPESVAPDRSIDARKSLRDTIVRRTIIIPAGIDFGDQRRPLFGSSRKSRRFASIEDQPVPNSDEVTKSFHFGSPTVLDDAALPVQENLSHQDSQNDADEQQQSQQGEDLPTLGSDQMLHPDSGTDGPSRSNRASRVESCYAGSLYDMYIGGGVNGEDTEFGSPESDLADISRARRSMAIRASRMPETRRHIEVTERADGSVVWQVIAGLADRGSVYSDFDARSSKHLSDASGSGAAAMADEGATEEETFSGAPFRTPAGLTDDDSRSFFTRPRAIAAKTTQLHHPAFSLDTNQPLPLLPLSKGQEVREDVFEIANPPNMAANSFDTDPTSSSSASSARNATASPTRIVYHNDAQLASLLDVLAQGKDSAKFQFHIGPNRSSMYQASTGAEQHLNGGASEDAVADSDASLLDAKRVSSPWSKHEGVLDANDIESHRSRVEAEIYTLLNRHALVGRE